MHALFFSLLLSCTLLVQAQTLTVPDFPAGRRGAEALVNYILSASPKERELLSRQLLPTAEDCQAVFPGKLGTKVYRYQRRLYRQARLVIRPLIESQTEYYLWGATQSELLDYVGEAREFPGGYHEMADDIAPEITCYRFKFVQPGHRLGSAYDILVHVNGHWRMIHRPWVVLFD
ncbi:MAG: hypothetical protein OHK0039_09650 [Bacteroidia bacterium]